VVGMTKEKYFEMCTALNSEPLQEEIPVEYEDLLIDVQEALDIYYKLKDEWDTMNGNYMGKNFSGLGDILEILEIPKEDRKTIFHLICTIDRHRSESLSERKKNTAK
jgi:hypothetical protein